MNKAAKLSAQLEKMTPEAAVNWMEESSAKALHSRVLGDTMCLMHDDGSVNMIEYKGGGLIVGEVISGENILKVLEHYRPFSEVFGSPGSRN